MTHLSSSPPKALQVIQITDSHLLGHEDALLKGIATWQTFRAVMEHAAREGPPPDLILATGDLVHEGPRAVYERLRAYIQRVVGAPLYAVPGNHDDPEVLAEVFPTGDGQGIEKHAEDGTVNFGHVKRGNWLMILLDTVVPGMDHGLLRAGELARLDTLLRNHPDSYALLCLHHHPVPFGRSGIDSIGLANADAFFSIVDRYPQVRGIVWGHIHNTFEAQRGGVMLFGAPATSFPFDAASERVLPTEGPPGYRRLTLGSDGWIYSHVAWA